MSEEYVDIYEPEQYVAGVPYEKYKYLREHAPVVFQREEDGPGYWALLKHADVLWASKRPRIFSSFKAGINIPDPIEEDLDIARMILINMDPPQHAKYRKLVSTGFTPKMTQRLDEPIRAAVKTILDRVSGQETVDFVGAIASQLPLFLIADLIGWPEDDRPLMFEWSDRVSRIDHDPEDARMAAMEFFGYCTDLLEALEGQSTHENRPDDLVHVLMDAQVDGERLNPMEIVNFLLLLAIGGNETTRNCIAGGYLALHEYPSQMQCFLSDPMEYSTDATEEMLRWTSPIIAFRRTALEDTEVSGQAIKAGDKVVLYYASANRDEDVFENADVFDITRKKNPHVSFGAGTHFCLGATLARMEIRILFEELLRRFPEMSPVGDVERLNSNYVNGTVAFTVRVGPDMDAS